MLKTCEKLSLIAALSSRWIEVEAIMLLGNSPLAQVFVYCADVQRSLLFYRDVLGLRLINEAAGSAHLDAGGVNLSLHPAGDDDLPPRGSFICFQLRDTLEKTCHELEARGLTFAQKFTDRAYGRTSSFTDPDGHFILLWEPPAPNDPKFPRVRELVEHQQKIMASLGS